MPRTHEVVLAWVEGELAAGRLGLGDRLPGERGLAEQLGVSRQSVREAVKVLEAMGVIRTGVGSGPTSGAAVVADPTAALSSALRLHTATHHLPIADVVQTRVLLESWAVRQAATSPRPVGLASAATLLDAMDDTALTADAFLALDVEFHLALSGAAGNVLVHAVMAALRASIRTYVSDAVPALPSWPDTAARLRREHRGVLKAVTAGHPDKAARRVTAHIEGFYRDTRLS